LKAGNQAVIPAWTPESADAREAATCGIFQGFLHPPDRPVHADAVRVTCTASLYVLFLGSVDISPKNDLTI